MLHKIASDTGYGYQLVEDIYFHEFEFVANEMASGIHNDPSTYKNILLKHFGSFLSNEKHINKLKEITNAKQDKTDTISV